MTRGMGGGVRGLEEQIHKGQIPRGLSSEFPGRQRGAAQNC